MIQNEQEMKQMIEQILRCEEEIGKSIIGQKAIIRQETAQIRILQFLVFRVSAKHRW